MTREDYLQYYIQGSDHYLIPKDIFDELFTETKNWKKEAHQYKEVIDKAIEYINLIVLGETLNGEPVLFKEEAEGQYLLDILKEVEHE